MKHHKQSSTNKKALAERKFAKKDLGQNFLQSTEVRDKIMMEAGDIHGKNILEIGPGLGFLTETILDAGAKLTAIEFDERAVRFLENKYGNYPNFTLINGSILDINLDDIFKTEPWQVIANIPYHITSPILRKLLSETKNKPTSCVLMAQKEVAEKIARTRCAQEKIIESRSILSLSVEIYAESKNCFEVKRTCFEPAPNVDSAILKLTMRDKPLIALEMENDFFTMVNAGFCERRKKLRNSLINFFGEDPTRLLQGIDGDRRAETLDIGEWITLTKNFRKVK
jgi:16S rRNA (adenine1518-N6/adenine1519-N6)-dimethyltransferase